MSFLLGPTPGAGSGSFPTAGAAHLAADPAALAGCRIHAIPMTDERRERLTPEHRLTTAQHYAEVKQAGVPFRGHYCLMLALVKPGETTRFGFIASRKGVGGAVQRNRARRRLRELVRRRWPRLSERGYWIALIAFRGALTAPHQDLATDVEHLLARAGALEPVGLAEPPGDA